MALQSSSELRNITTPIKSTSLGNGAYVLSIVPLSSFYAVSASAPNNAIYLFSKSHLQLTQTLPGHGDALTNLKSISRIGTAGGSMLLSCGRDGVVRAWDERTNAAAVQMSTAGARRVLLSCDASSNGMLVAAGTDLQGDDASILYWDPRSPAAPLRSHSSTHSDDITALHFLKPDYPTTAQASRTLLSASSDGLISTSNVEEEDEDEAVLHVGNWGCSIAQTGWVNHANRPPGIWASSDMETFSVWSGELDLAQNMDIRQPSLQRQDLTWVTDYLIGCHSYGTVLPGTDNDLGFFVGSNEGDIALLSRPSLEDPDAPWLLTDTWTTGHSEIVRAALWDESNNVLISGGEDSKLNAWSIRPRTDSQHGNSSLSNRKGDETMDVDMDESTPSRKRMRA